MKIFVDIDETICITPISRDYSEATPLKERIEKINKLYDDKNINSETFFKHDETNIS